MQTTGWRKALLGSVCLVTLGSSATLQLCRLHTTTKYSTIAEAKQLLVQMMHSSFCYYFSAFASSGVICSLEEPKSVYQQDMKVTHLCGIVASLVPAASGEYGAIGATVSTASHSKLLY